MSLDRTDNVAIAGAVARIVGLFLIHPALLLVAAGYLAVTNTRRAV